MIHLAPFWCFQKKTEKDLVNIYANKVNSGWFLWFHSPAGLLFFLQYFQSCFQFLFKKKKRKKFICFPKSQKYQKLNEKKRSILLCSNVKTKEIWNYPVCCDKEILSLVRVFLSLWWYRLISTCYSIVFWWINSYCAIFIQ